MLKFVAKRLLLAIPTVLLVGVITFTLSRLAPGDPARVFLGPGASPEAIELLRDQWRLDDPLPAQLIAWLSNLFRGDLGESLRFNEPVADVFWRHVGPTASIIAFAIILMVSIGVPLGLAAARWKGSWIDKGSMSLAFAAVAVPEFWLGMLLVIVFAVQLGWFPVSGYVPPTGDIGAWIVTIILPSVALALGQIGLLARMVRDSVITAGREQWVTSLRARGLGEASIFMKHLMKSATIPAITVIGTSMAALITGAVVIETVFNIRGVGWLTINSTMQRDYALVQGTVFMAAVAYVLINLVIDALYAVIDPRIRLAGA
jgi:peptide/nickel transport system permease protein